MPLLWRIAYIILLVIHINPSPQRSAPLLPGLRAGESPRRVTARVGLGTDVARTGVRSASKRGGAVRVRAARIATVTVGAKGGAACRLHAEAGAAAVTAVAARASVAVELGTRRLVAGF